MMPEIEIVDSTTESIRYLEHGWPSDFCRWHAHQEYELHLIVDGRGEAFVGDYIGNFEQGSLYLTGPNLPHNWVTEADESEPMRVRDMLVQFNRKSFKGAALSFHEIKEIMPLLDLARSGVEFIGFPFKVAHSHMCRIRETRGIERIVEFLSFMNELDKHQDKAVLSNLKLEQKSGNKHYDKIGKIVDHIVKRYNEELSVADAAGMVGMSETSFSRNFHSSTGNRFVDFVNQVRIGHACLLLQETDARISTICYDVGFQNLANFNRQFYKLKRITPSRYRKFTRTKLQYSTAPGVEA